MSKNATSSVDLFTPDEHAILAEWFRVARPDYVSDMDIFVDDAIRRLGLDRSVDFYRPIDAAVAFIVLDRIEQSLPAWGGVSGNEVVVAREYRDRETAPDRKVILQPKFLLEINWADSGPGYSWPVAYYATWVPIYDRFVVTASSDSPVFGYCDFALGSFKPDTPIRFSQGSLSIIGDDWATQKKQLGQQRWAYLLRSGLITEEEANSEADEVWGSDKDLNEFGDADC